MVAVYDGYAVRKAHQMHQSVPENIELVSSNNNQLTPSVHGGVVNEPLNLKVVWSSGKKSRKLIKLTSSKSLSVSASGIFDQASARISFSSPA